MRPRLPHCLSAALAVCVLLPVAAQPPVVSQHRSGTPPESETSLWFVRTMCLDGGVPIGADRDPTKLSFSWPTSNVYPESAQGPCPMLFHTDPGRTQEDDNIERVNAR
jgi:hypothetical protein